MEVRTQYEPIFPDHLPVLTAIPLTICLYAQASPEAAIISKQVVIIDNCHLRGHTDPRCNKMFNPKKHPLAKDFNTQVAEQTFSWFGNYKHIGRYMLESYWVLIIGMFNERNQICQGRNKARVTRSRKRKREQMDFFDDTNGV